MYVYIYIYTYTYICPCLFAADLPTKNHRPAALRFNKQTVLFQRSNISVLN